MVVHKSFHKKDVFFGKPWLGWLYSINQKFLQYKLYFKTFISYVLPYIILQNLIKTVTVLYEVIT